MASSDVQRKLTAILVSDVVGYSRLMGDDPEGTLTTLTTYRQVFSDKIKDYKGRVVNAPGDSLLAEFGSVLDAISCAVDIQRELAERNQELPDNRRMDFRIGVTLGDVLVKEEALYGDGVNIAARLESLAEPGGICISGKAHTEVQSRLPLHFEYLGEQVVKNIAEPVKAYRVLSKPGDAAHRVIGAKKKLAVKWRKIALAAAVLVVLGVGGLLAWNYWQPALEPSKETVAESLEMPLAKKPSIAVLAFENMSGDKEREYFSDAFSEDLITQLSRLPRLSVVARNSSFRYKGRAVDVRQVGRELGVRHVVEGSIQRAGSRLRITAQLIEVATGKHVWVERYDRELKDLFALQDEITLKIALEVLKQLEVKLTQEEVARITAGRTGDPQAWEYYAQGREHLLKPGWKVYAMGKFEKALELDPEFEPAILGLGWANYEHARGQSLKGTLEEAEQLARRVIALNSTLAEPYSLLGMTALVRKQYDQAIIHTRRAVVLNPNYADGHRHLSEVLRSAGRPEEALAEYEKFKALEPFPSTMAQSRFAQVLYQLGRYEEALGPLQAYMDEFPGAHHRITRLMLIACYSALGRPEARKMAEEYETSPRYIIEEWMLWKNPADIDRLLADLAKAGLK